MPRAKISVIGTGHVGESVTLGLAQAELGDVVTVDIVPDMPVGKGLDILQSGPVYGFDSRVIGSNSYDDTKGSDIVVITSGVPRKPGMSRDDLLKVNLDIVKDVTRKVVEMSPNCIILMVANPLDAMTYVAYKVSGFPKNRVVGMAGILDTARFRTFLAMELDVSVESIQALVLGGHGDTMVPLARYTTVAGVPVTELVPKDRLDAIIKRTRDGGGEIVKLLKTGSAYYAPSAAVVEMVESILKDKKKILPCCALCQGEYGIDNVFVGVPVKLGRNGVEEIFQVRLTDEEQDALNRSAKAVKELCDIADRIGL
jgi:malate dehydrogenase